MFFYFHVVQHNPHLHLHVYHKTPLEAVTHDLHKSFGIPLIACSSHLYSCCFQGKKHPQPSSIEHPIHKHGSLESNNNNSKFQILSKKNIQCQTWKRKITVRYLRCLQGFQISHSHKGKGKKHCQFVTHMWIPHLPLKPN